MNYKVYLQGEHWKLMRRLRLEVDTEQCTVCGSKNQLNVHHKTYDRIGAEKLSDLITLCQECHAKYHNKLGKGNFDVKRIVSSSIQNKKEFTMFEVDEIYSKVTLKNCTLETGEVYIDEKFIKKLPGLRTLKINNVDVGLREFVFKYRDQEIKKVEMIIEEKEISFNYSEKEKETFLSEISTMSYSGSKLSQKQLNVLNKNLEVGGIIKALEEKDVLINAIQRKSFELVEVLLNKGYNINKRRNGNNYTPLDYISSSNEEKYFHYFLKRGAIPNEVTLEIAARHLSLKNVEIILSYGIKVSDQALLESVNNEDFEVTKLLLSKGGNINLRDHAGNTLLMKFIHFRKFDNIGFLLANGSKKDVKNTSGYTPLLLGLQVGSNEDQILDLFNKEFDTFGEDPNGNSSLFLACHRNFESVIKKLINFLGADVNKVNNYGETILMRASSECSDEIIKLIISKGAEINAKDNKGDTALNRAIQRNKYEIIKFFLDKNIDINSVNNQGNTPLMEALVNNQLEIAKLLLNYGADKTIKNEKTNKTALNIAMDRKQIEILDFLKD